MKGKNLILNGHRSTFLEKSIRKIIIASGSRLSNKCEFYSNESCCQVRADQDVLNSIIDKIEDAEISNPNLLNGFHMITNLTYSTITFTRLKSFEE